MRASGIADPVSVTSIQYLYLPMQHVEFFHKDHFEHNYHRVYPIGALSKFIEFFWETDFDLLWKKHPKGFSDALFPNVGYTYLINLGTPFVMQVDKAKFEMKGDGFLPRPTNIECFHQPGNRLFGIKFKISPVIFEKEINFSEYQQYIFPLSYLMEVKLIDQIKQAGSFEQRVKILTAHYQKLISQHADEFKNINIVTAILDRAARKNAFTVPIESLASQYGISSRTLQRYFEKATGTSSKKALQIMRIRKAVAHLVNDASTFHYSDYGYYDYSHFYKHLKEFLRKKTLSNLKLQLKSLQPTSKSDLV
jgi:AraC-like DNA-binding protein